MKYHIIILQDILASELAAYAYWVHFDKDFKGYMTIPDFVEFLKVNKIYDINKKICFRYSNLA